MSSLRWACRATLAPFLAAGLLLAASPSASAADPLDTLSLDADYTGSASLHSLYSFTLWTYGASGANATAPSGLTEARFQLEGGFDFFGDRASFTQSDPALFYLGDGQGGSLAGGITSSGTITSYDGSFAVSQGEGRYAGYQGIGTFHVAAGPFAGPDTPFPATLSVRGTLTRASAVPEPGTLPLLAVTLLALPILGLPARRHSARRPA